MLTVVTQNCRLPRRSALSGDRPGLTRLSCKIGYLLTSNPADHQPLPNSSRATNIIITTSIEYVSRAGKLRTLAVVFRDPDSPLEEIRKASRGKHLICVRPRHAPRLCPNRSGAPDCALSVVASSKSRQEQAGGQAAATSAARAAILPTLVSLIIARPITRHQHIDMVTRGAPSSSRSNDPWPSYLGVWRSYRNFDLSKGRVDLTCSRPMQRPLNRPGHHTLSLES
jgi:hypothetical protein